MGVVIFVQLYIQVGQFIDSTSLMGVSKVGVAKLVFFFVCRLGDLLSQLSNGDLPPMDELCKTIAIAANTLRNAASGRPRYHVQIRFRAKIETIDAVCLVEEEERGRGIIKKPQGKCRYKLSRQLILSNMVYIILNCLAMIKKINKLSKFKNYSTKT